MKQALLIVGLMVALPASAQDAPAPSTPAPDAQAPAPAPEAQAPAASTESQALPSPAAAEQPPAPAPATTEIPAPKKKEKPPHVRPWWSWAGIGSGLAISALSVLTVVAGIGVQVLALRFWVEQANPPVGAKREEREFLTLRARNTQWIALGMIIPGIAAFFGGLILATYAFGYGNPDPKTAKEF